MKNTFILLLVLFSQALSAQDWSLYPQGQVTFWQRGQGGLLSMYYNDVSVANGIGTTHFFGKQYYQGLEYDTCVVDLYDRFIANVTGNYPNNPLVDTLTSYANGEWQFTQGGYTANLFTNAQVGDIWGFSGNPNYGIDSISLECTEISYGSVLNYSDSVKSYRLKVFTFSGLAHDIPNAYVLTKHAGLIRGLPLRELLLGGAFIPWEIYGFDHATAGHFGFTSAYQDYYCTPQLGDVEYWEGSEIIGGVTIRKTWRDSVTQVQSVNGETIMSYNRVLRSYNFTTSVYNEVTSNFIDTLAAWRYQIANGAVFRQPFNNPQEYGAGYFQFTAQFQLNLNLSNSNIVTADVPGYCFVELSDNIYISQTYRRYVGLIDESSSSQVAYSYRHLLGKLQCGTVNGDLHFNTVGTSTPTDEALLQVFPNPSNGVIYLQTPNPQATYNLVLTDAMGRVLLQNSNFQGTSFNIESLPAGYYNLRLNNADGSFVAKIIKQ